MRVLMTAAAAALSMGLLAAPAFADDSNPGYGGRNGGAFGQGKPPQSEPYRAPDDRDGRRAGRDDRGGDAYGDDRGRGGNRGYGGRDDDERAYDARESDFQAWERGWGGDRRGRDRHGYRDHGRVLNHWQLVRRIERQGFYDVRRLGPSRHGYGWRAFARYRFDGHRAMLRIDPYTGRVIAVRHL